MLFYLRYNTKYKYKLEDINMNTWHGVSTITGRSYNCGYCGKLVGPSLNYWAVNNSNKIFICPNCGNPTYYNASDEKYFPGSLYGDEVRNLPSIIQNHYNEARWAYSVNSYTGAVLLCRKIIMNVAVDCKADEDKQFLYYINYLKDEGYIGKTSFDWVNRIRDSGNNATHELPNTSKIEAEEIIHFTYMLLKTIYEFVMPSN